MAFRIEVVDPLPFAADASRILTASWKPPCLKYSPEYLRWQFSFPGESPNLAAVASASGTPVGCAGVTVRQVLFRGATFPVYVLSFLAVEPAERRKGLADAMYDALLDRIALPVVAFAESNSKGQQLLLRAFMRKEFLHRQLKQCQGVGYLARQARAANSILQATEVVINSHAGEMMTCDTSTPDAMVNFPTSAQWRHYRSDPRPRKCVVVRKGGGPPVGSGMVVLTEFVTNEGTRQVPMLESVCLDESDALEPLFFFTTEQGSNATTAIASNLSCVEPLTIRSAGARYLPSTFEAHLFSEKPHPLTEASAVNLEVI